MKAHRSLALAATLVASLAVAPTAHAHGDAHLDATPSAHGGQVRMAGPLHLELVLAKEGTEVKDRPIVVHVTDHGEKPLSTAGATASIVLLSGKTKVTAPLKPEGGNRLTGLARYAAVPGLKAVVSVTLPGRDTEQARFTPFKAAHDHEQGSHPH